MKKFKFSKKNIFTLLGLLVIVGSIPLTIILVQQNQEIRKEAVYPITDDSGCKSIGGTCQNKNIGLPCPGGYKPLLCPGPDEIQCCKPSAGGATPGGIIEPGTSYTGPSSPVWHLYNTDRTCSVSKPTSTSTPPKKTSTPTPTGTGKPTPTPTLTSTPTPTSTPTLTLTITPTPTLTLTPTPTPTPTGTPTPTPTPTGTPTPTPTPTPTIPVGCNQSCSSDTDCNSGLICYNSSCRNSSCTSETDCTCPGPTPIPTVTPTLLPEVTPTTAVMAEATPAPVELPQAGFTLPTFGAILGGILFVILASVLFLL